MASDKKLIDHSSLLNDCLLGSMLAPTVSENLVKWIQGSNLINILVSGKIGTGKSTLINGIIGQQVTKEGHKLTAETSEIQKHTLHVNDVTVNIFDTPGLEDDAQQDAVYIEKVKAVYHGVDLFLYCIKMSETRFFNTCYDAVAMDKVTKALGQEIWENGLIVLTFANVIIGDADDKGEDKYDFFQEKYKKFVKKLKTFLQEVVKVTPEVVTNLPIVCAGHVKTPVLPSIAPEHLESSSKKDSHWLSYLWLKALRRTKLDAQPAMIKLNLHRIRNPKDYSTEEILETTYTIIEMQPIMLGQQGAEMYKGLGENFELFGQFNGEEAGKLISANMGSNVVALLIDLAVQHGILICIDKK